VSVDPHGQPVAAGDGASEQTTRPGSISGDNPRSMLPPTSPRVSRPLLRWFTWYARHYVRRHFHSLRVSRSGLPVTTPSLPLVVYSNHASWWDPMVGILLTAEFFAERTAYAPIDEAALQRYAFFQRLGMFGVEQGTRRGAGQFLRLARGILQSPARLLWLTPQGRFADARERPAKFRHGIGHLPNLAPRLCFLPVAIEYVFWEERLPEILIRFGVPFETRAGPRKLTPAVWADFFADRLSATQDALAAEAGARKPENFQGLLHGQAGVGGLYDRWRGLRARLRGERFRAEHGRL
jgi:1-acyl-sn-glycerol-3-phosphate acyltransferase